MKTQFVRPSVLLPVLLMVALALVPTLAGAIGAQFYIGFLARILVYALAASALNLALGYGGLIGFGHALFVGLGAYCVSLPSFFGLENGWLQLLLVLGACGLIGLLTGAICLRTRGIGFIMITLAFSQMGYFVFVSLKQFGGDDGMSIIATSRLGAGIDLGSAVPLYYTAWIILALVIVWMTRLRNAPFGMALRAARQNQARVNALGFPARRFQLIAYTISAMLCGVAGFLLANLNAYASPGLMSWQVSGELIVMVVLGGMGSVFGPLLGALAFIGLEELMKSYTEHWMLIFGPIIVLVALSGKDGLMGALLNLDRRLAGGGPSKIQGAGRAAAAPAHGAKQ
ncbi:branched-chain amino acid ABC transporter permease [Herbaspirillum sp. alder98]|uniref:branched-chain amino acid ABC transporter permease n=1 Tax=Herbaspirillum sp. alder98 TaxID=2913096 RepID=UPI001CD824EA|nr:branched-chain amino acid ABC transporter permease [Herbaspirillum sp. alder98]MCA1326856.1 branched-chain amino acid ABC transporter permease [Herbaspirillum sp. alder98]